MNCGNLTEGSCQSTPSSRHRAAPHESVFRGLSQRLQPSAASSSQQMLAAAGGQTHPYCLMHHDISPAPPSTHGAAAAPLAALACHPPSESKHVPTRRQKDSTVRRIQQPAPPHSQHACAAHSRATEHPAQTVSPASTRSPEQDSTESRSTSSARSQTLGTTEDHQSPHARHLPPQCSCESHHPQTDATVHQTQTTSHAQTHCAAQQATSGDQDHRMTQSPSSSHRQSTG